MPPKTPTAPRHPEKSDPHGRVRMIGEREETVAVALTDSEVAEQDRVARDLRNRIDQLEDQAKTASADFKSKQKVLEEQERVARRKASTRRAEVDIRIQEWLTRGNEVVRVNADTGEQLGPARTARAAELQEALPFDQSNDDDSGGTAFEDA